jgi:CCR4-NOT transcription complex subunit 9
MRSIGDACLVLLSRNVLYIRTNSYLPSFMAQIQLSQSKSRPFEYLRLTSLGVIGALVKVDDAEVISFLLSTEIIPLCLRIMETGSELSKTVSTFIVQKILLEETGLNYVCATAERFFAVSQVLANMVSLLTVHPSVRLLKHVVRCYLRLADHARAREALKTCLPSSLRDATFATALQNDPVIQKWLQQLLANISGNGGPASAPTGATSAAAGGSNAPSLLSSAAGVPQASSTAAANSNPSAGLGLLDMSNAAGKAQ